MHSRRYKPESYKTYTFSESLINVESLFIVVNVEKKKRNLYEVLKKEDRFANKSLIWLLSTHELKSVITNIENVL